MPARDKEPPQALCADARLSRLTGVLELLRYELLYLSGFVTMLDTRNT